MFDRAAQVNARFAGGSSRQAEVVDALHELGLGEGHITVIERADTGEWREPASAPGWFARLLGRRGAGVAPAAAAPDLLILVHLGQDDTLSGPVQDVFRRFGATRVDHYPPSRVATRVFGAGGASQDAGAEE